MCCTGDLPADWQPRVWWPALRALRELVAEYRSESENYENDPEAMGVYRDTANAIEEALAGQDAAAAAQLAAVPDPRITAQGDAAAKARWDLAASPGTVLGPARVELMGHRIRIGVVSEVTLLGQTMLRIDFPHDDENRTPEFYTPSSIYGILPGGEPEWPTPVARGTIPDYEDPF